MDVIKKAGHAHTHPREGDSEHYARVRAKEASTDPPNPLAEESSKRFAFCEMHRRMLGQECHRQAVIDGRQSGNREAALNGCLLWQVVKAEPNLDRLAGVEVLEGVTVADCQAMLADCKESPDLFRRDRRWLLVFAACIRNRQSLTTENKLEEP